MAPTQRIVDNQLVKSASLHKLKPLSQHLYIWPFALTFPVFASFLFPFWADVDHNSLLYELRTFFLGIFFALQIFVWLTGHWNTQIRTILAYSPCKTIDESDAIHIKPIANQGRSEICPIIRENEFVYFYFQKRKFIYNQSKKQFTTVELPIDKKPLIGDLQRYAGFSSTNEITKALQVYDKNKFDIPIPSFTELFKEHAVAPFFVFQIFCVLLWCLDEYIYYSLFTLVMLVGFECTVVWQRQRTLQEFRSMSIKPYQIHAFRQKKWTEISTEDLLPGDLVAIGRSEDDHQIPCDLILLQGTCVVNEAMLSGESTPVVKESIAFRDENEPVDITGVDKGAVLFSGTSLLQATFSTSDYELRTNVKMSQPPKDTVPAIVIRTAFETSQGSLVRVMVCSHEHVSANNFEALLFILFLLVFAIAAAWYVWTRGINEGRNRWKLLLDCILIITSVVPPELPMELSIAANSSLAALTKFHIFCSEPFRIPFAGKVDVCCFDKTGTLTQDKLIARGIVTLSSKETWKLSDLKTSTGDALLSLATAHSLAKLENEKGEIVGDPMEKATLEAIDWTIVKNGEISAPVDSSFAHSKVSILKHYPFSSALKRQATISDISTQKGSRYFAAVKGAPEVIKLMLKEIPDGYDSAHKEYSREGYRVIALACKTMEIKKLSASQLKHLERDTVECSLSFCGFMVFSSPLKPDAKDTIVALNNSSHRCIMITGDSALTACHVAKEINLLKADVLILDTSSNESHGVPQLEWRSVDDSKVITVSIDDPLPDYLLPLYEFCVTGSAFTILEKTPEALEKMAVKVWVWARLAPLQKEHLITILKNDGMTTLMCGDGTNDVGALKQAHVGVAMLNSSEDDLKKIAKHNQNRGLQMVYEKQLEVSKRFNLRTPPVPLPIAHLYPPGPTNPHHPQSRENNASQVTPEDKGQEMVNNMMKSLTEGMEEEAPQIKLGDASVAAPFTSKLSACDAITKIIRQGRCTLVATIQMYKILALNCLISAYSLSVLYLDGIKFDDTQAVISGMLISVCFLCISKAKPLETLSRQRPQSNIFNMYIIGSILGQFFMHIATLRYVAALVNSIDPIVKNVPVDLEKKFEPTLMNSAIFLLQLSQQVSTFAVNYIGKPFRESMTENKGMYWGLVACLFVAFSGSTEFVPELNERLKFVPFTNDFKTKLTLTMAIDFLACYAIEAGFKWAFSNDQPKPITYDQVQDINTLKEREE